MTDSEIIAAQEAERRKIARDIHDGPAQSLAAILLKLDLLMAGPAINDKELLQQELLQLKGIIQDIIKEMRQILSDLRPVNLEQENILIILEEYFAELKTKFDFRVNFKATGMLRNHPPHVKTAIFRLIQEAVNNSRKHAGVNGAEVEFHAGEEKIEISIIDTGKGFIKDQEIQKDDRFGLAGMIERADTLGGSIEIISEPGNGTRILIGIPLKERDDDGENQSSYRR